MINIGTVKGQEIKKNRNGAIDVRMLTVQLSNESDTQSVQYFNPSGEDSAPIVGDQVVVFEMGPAFKFACCTQDVLAAVMGAGEKKLYSRDGNGDIAAFINLLSGGDIELNGNANTAVRFAALQTAFDELKTAFNSHVHTDPQGGSVGPASPQSAADISTAESDTVKLL